MLEAPHPEMDLTVLLGVRLPNNQPVIFCMRASDSSKLP